MSENDALREWFWVLIIKRDRHYEELFDGLRRQAQERNVILETVVFVVRAR